MAASFGGVLGDEWLKGKGSGAFIPLWSIESSADLPIVTTDVKFKDHF
ncbi:hypothetical protein ACN4EG_06410 [Alkalinema pantanalense CENA528]